MTARAYARRYAALTGLRWFAVGLVVPVLVLLMQARGLSLAQVGQLMALYGATVVVLELPTGGLADSMGRRPVLAVSSLLSAAGSLVLALADSWWALVGAVVLLGTGRALGSGPLEAWYVDSVRGPDPDADISTGISHAQAVEAVALGVGALVGGALPALAHAWWSGPGSAPGSLIALSVPFLASAIMLLVHAVAVVVVVDEPDPIGGRDAGGPAPAEGARSLAAWWATVRSGVRVVGDSGDLRRLIGYATILGMTLGGIELIAPGTFAVLLGGAGRSTAGYGLLVSLSFAASALGAVLAPRIAGRLRSQVSAVVVLGVGAAPLVLLIGVPLLGVAGAAFVALYFVLGATGPLLAGLLHDRIDSAHRSTVLSVESLAMQLGGISASLLLGGLVTATGILAGYVLSALAFLVGAVLLRGIRTPAPLDPAPGPAGTQPAPAG